MSKVIRNNGKTDLLNLPYTQEIPLFFDLGPKDHIIVKLHNVPKSSKRNGKVPASPRKR
jgi:hypothetical protein